MELRHLRAFLAVAEEGTISRAALRLHLTQSALSRQIKALEQDLSVGLLDRGAHSIKLTQEGEILVREGRRVIEQADLTIQKVRSAGQAITLRVGYAPSLTVGMLPPAIEAFTQRHPRVRVELQDLSSVEMQTGLEQAALDIIVSVPPSKPDPLIHWESLHAEAWRLAIHRTHPWQAKSVITASDLNGQRLVLFCQRDYPEYWQRVTSWFKEQGIQAKVAGEYDGANSLAAAVEAGLGAALVVERMACSFPHRLVLKPLHPTPPPVVIAAGIATSQRADPILQVFVEELKRAAQTH